MQVDEVADKVIDGAHRGGGGGVVLGAQAAAERERELYVKAYVDGNVYHMLNDVSAEQAVLEVKSRGEEVCVLDEADMPYFVLFDGLVGLGSSATS
eukprot:2525409-Pleurochrysis_carterae.AAC.2